MELVHKAAVFLTNRAIKFSVCKDSEYDIYVYWFETFLGQIITYFLLVFIGIAMKCLFQIIIYISFFGALCGRASGYHSKTHLGCIIATCTVSIIAVSIAERISIDESVFIYPILSIAIAYIAFKAPINHVNLNLSTYEIVCCRKYIKRILLVESILIGMFYFYNITAIAIPASLAIITVAVSMILAKILKQEMKEDTHAK